MKKNNPMPGQPAAPSYNASGKPAKKKKSGLMGRIIRRFFLLLFTTIFLLLGALILAANMMLTGPSVAAQEMLTTTLLEPSATKWIPALFIGEERVQEIKNSGSEFAMTDTVTDTNMVVINTNQTITASGNEWANSPDGVRFEEHRGDTYTAHIMIVRDPAQVYLGISNKDGFSRNVPGKRMNEIIPETGAIAGVNAGAFFDDGTSSPAVGSTPEGLVYSEGKCVWKTGAPPNDAGFAGFNEDNILIVTPYNMTESEAQQLKIRDGVCFGPALIINGEINMEVYNGPRSLNPRTGIGQRSDGAVIFVCIDGRQPGALGGSYQDLIDIMVEYGAVNACNMDGGSSTIMMYQDSQGLFGTAGELATINSYSLLQEKPRRMPDFWLVRPAA